MYPLVQGFALGNPAIQGLSQPASFVPKSGSNSELYGKAYDILKDDIPLSSYITRAERDEGVRLVVQNVDGRETLIKAKRLLVTAAPSIDNLASIALDDQESAVFSCATPLQFPETSRYKFISPEAAPNNYLDLYKDMDYDLKIQSTGPEDLQLYRVLLETTYVMSADEAKALIANHLQKLESAGTLDSIKQGADGSGIDLELVALVNHNSICWRLAAEELKVGFV